MHKQMYGRDGTQPQAQVLDEWGDPVDRTQSVTDDQSLAKANAGGFDFNIKGLNADGKVGFQAQGKAAPASKPPHPTQP